MNEKFVKMSLNDKIAYALEHPCDPDVREWISGYSADKPFESLCLTDKMIYANAYPDDPAVRRWLNPR